MREQPNYYAIIPANVRYDKKLRANEKLMYGEITALSNVYGYCFASNNYFAELYKVTPQAISKWISDLKNKGYIEVDFKYKDDTKEIDKRIIKIVSTNDLGGINKCLIPYKQMFNDNNTRANNEELKDIEYIVDYLNKKAKTKYRYQAADTQKHIKARLNEGFTVDDFKTVIDKKVDEWNGTDMQKFLRPSTLFGSKFESYLNQPKKVIEIKKEPWRVGGEPNFDIDKIAHDTMYNDDYDV